MADSQTMARLSTLERKYNELLRLYIKLFEQAKQGEEANRNGRSAGG